MTIGAFITKTHPEKRGDPFKECYDMASELCDKVTVIDGAKTWPQEFDWKIIGEHFQRGYEQTDTDWVLHLDCDFFFHEKDFQRIWETLGNFDRRSAVTFPKYQFFVKDRFNVKSNLVLAVNKGVYGSRIRFDGGGDLCQPTINGEYITPVKTIWAKVPVYNYDNMFKTKPQIMEDKGRFARAWQRTFGTYKLGGPDDESAYKEWWKMTVGRFTKHLEVMEFNDHPKFIKQRLASLTPEQFGYNMFGHA